MKGLFIDDKDTESPLAKNLSKITGGKIEFTYRSPDVELTKLVEEIWNSGIDVLALDYRLDEQQSGADPKNRYRAGALAQLIRERTTEQPGKDIPIVLVSVEENVRKYYRPDLTAHDLFDRIYTKDEIINEDGKGAELIGVALGYQQIKEGLKYKSLSTILSTADADSSFLLDADIQELIAFSAPHQVAHRIFEVLIDRPGLLLRPMDLHARLGTSKESKDIPVLMSALHEAKVIYEGAFSEGWQRFWTHRLIHWGRHALGVDFGSLPGSERVEAINKKLGTKITPAISRWSKKSDVLFAVACASCESPAELQFTLPAADRTRFKVIERKRICWACIQSGENEEQNRKIGVEVQVDPSSALIAKKLKSGAIVQSKE